ncbi:hypothetical protein FZC68_05810 [Bacillus pumilus]|uniref:hypothetical protein n=1 Tax=Bacillus pumilus TaxID=1408 RepID=UPI0011E9252D|nr:hypothetical protein [Bacillus pumilus]TYS43590.1 hypothetical protein FZC68_05810 [Bacillus pumilus]
MHIFLYDENFMYLGEDVISDYEEIPKNATDVRPQEGLYLPEYDEKKRVWFESASKEYIESLQPKPQPSKIGRDSEKCYGCTTTRGVVSSRV